MRRVYLVLAGLLGAAVAVLPSLAAGDSPPATATFTAVDFAWQANGGTGQQANIAVGGTVSFGYPSGSTQHNADFGTGPQPTNCTQTGGATSGSVPPLPNQPTSSGWTGTCTFNTAGTYTFHCDLHPFMTGTIVVGTPTGTTTGTTGTTPTTHPSTTTSTQPPTQAPPPTEPQVPTTPQGPTGHPAATGASIPVTERGNAVTGVVDISPAGAGGRLEVGLFAPRGALKGRTARLAHARPAAVAPPAAAARPATAPVGRFVRANLRPGRVRFSAPLSPRARRALRGRGHLLLTVVISVRAPGASTTTLMRRVRLRPGRRR